MIQKFCNIFVTKGTVQHLQVLQLKSWKWYTILWDVELSWYSLSATYLIYFYGLEHGFCTFICITFKSHMKWSNVQCVSAPAAMILPTSPTWTVLVTCNTHCKLTHTKILQNFWFTTVTMFLIIQCKFLTKKIMKWILFRKIN